MKAIFAVNSAGGFGTGVDMPWPRNSADLTRFKTLTWGSPVVMGRGTWCSNMPKPLPGRHNIVLSRGLIDSRATVCPDTTSLFSVLGDHSNAWVIGGCQVLWALRPWITDAYITTFPGGSRTEVNLDLPAWLDGFTHRGEQILDDHRFDIWRLA